MKPYHIVLSLAMLMILSASCSRQVASLKSTTQLQTASSLELKPADLSLMAEKKHEVIIDHPFTLIKHSALTEPEKLHLIKKLNSPEIVNYLTSGIKKMAPRHSSDFSILQRNTTERGYPQINKAGFILIAGGILGFLLHLILIACVILAAIGLIVLISPLFRKRY